MSLTRSPDLFSLADSLDAGTSMKLRPISKGTGIPGTWDEATQDRQSLPRTPRAPVRSTLASVNIVAACTSSLMITSALGSAITISLPYVGEDLHIQKESLQWILSAYSISSACFLLLFGRLADLYGRKLVWVIGYLITGTCGFGSCFVQCMSDSRLCHDLLSWIINNSSRSRSWDIARHITWDTGNRCSCHGPRFRRFSSWFSIRAVSKEEQPRQLGILSRDFPSGSSRSIAFATFSAGAPVGSAFSTVLSSVLTQLTSPTWRSPLYLLSGFTFACLALGIFAIDEDEPSTEEDRRVDWIGAALITSGLILIVFVLSATPSTREGWKAPHIIGLFVFGVFLVLLFGLWQYFLEQRLEDPNLPRTRWTAPPLMKPSMLAHARGRFAVMQIIACVNWAAFSCWLVWVQLYYQTYLNLTPIHTMIRILPMFFMGIVANVIIALIIGRIDVVYIVAIGTLLTGCANIYFAVIDPSAPYWATGFPSACLIVLGADFTFASGTMFISKVSPPNEQSVAGALFQAMTQIGSAIGLSVSTIVFNGVLKAQSSLLGVTMEQGVNGAPLEAQLKAYQAAMWTGFAFGIFCTTLCVFLRGVGIVGERPK